MQASLLVFILAVCVPFALHAACKNLTSEDGIARAYSTARYGCDAVGADTLTDTPGIPVALKIITMSLNVLTLTTPLYDNLRYIG